MSVGFCTFIKYQTAEVAFFLILVSMKSVFFFIISIICLSAKSQSKKFPPDSLYINVSRENSFPPINHPFVDAVVFTRHHDRNAALVYLDSKLVVDLPVLDPNTIEDVKIESGYNEKYKTIGNVYLITKKSTKLNLLTADDIRKKYSLTNTNQTIWMVDNDFVERVEYFKIDSSYLYKIEVEELPALDSTNKNTSGLTIIRIFTRTPENINRFSGIRIRGLNAKL